MIVALPADVSPQLDLSGALAVASVVALWATCLILARWRQHRRR